MKSADSEVAETLAKAEAIATGVDLDTLQKGNSPMPITDEEREALPENVRKYLEDQEEAVAKSIVEDAVTKTVVPQLTEAEQFEKDLESVPESVRKAIAVSQREAAEAKEIAKRLEDQRAEAEFSAVIKTLSHVPEVNDDFAPTLRKIAASNPEEYAALAKVLTASEAMLKNSELFTEAGSGLGAVPGSAQEKLEGIAKSLEESDKLTPAAALAKAAQTPEGRKLYIEYRRDLNERAAREVV